MTLDNKMLEHDDDNLVDQLSDLGEQELLDKLNSRFDHLLEEDDCTDCDEDEDIKEVGLLLHSSSEKKIYDVVKAVYQKGSLLCISFWDQGDGGKLKVHKYPLANVFRVEEEY